MYTIAMNAGAEGAVVVGELLKADNAQWGHNAATGEYCDMIAAGIIDPTKVGHTRDFSIHLLSRNDGCDLF